jgi:hypothetical protein
MYIFSRHMFMWYCFIIIAQKNFNGVVSTTWVVYINLKVQAARKSARRQRQVRTRRESKRTFFIFLLHSFSFCLTYLSLSPPPPSPPTYFSLFLIKTYMIYPPFNWLGILASDLEVMPSALQQTTYDLVPPSHSIFYLGLTEVVPLTG